MTLTAATTLPAQSAPADFVSLRPEMPLGVVINPSLPANAEVSQASVDPWELLDQAVGYAIAADQVIAEQNARIAELERLALTDPLTELCNRRAFEQALEEMLDMIRRHGDTAMLIYVDLDRFKPINDEFGHEAGDRMLQHAAKILKSGLRSSDVTARLGGDEFAALLRRADPNEGMRRARAIRSRLNQANLRFAGQTLILRASLGVHVISADDSVDEALRQADRAMYSDKTRRRSAAA